MKLATTTSDFAAYTQDPAEALRYIHEAGFNFADYNFGTDYARQSGAFAEDWQAQMQRVRAAADALGMQFVQSHAPMGTPIVRDEKYEGFIACNLRCIECCAILGIDRIVVHSGYEYGLTKEQVYERNKEFYMRLLPTAEKLGVHVLVENFNKMHKEGVFWIDNAPDLREMVDYVNHPYFHACWDAGHANMQEMPQDEAIRMMGDHVYAIHVQDNMGDHDTHHVPLFGTLSLDAMMHGLIDVDYKGAFVFECSGFFASSKNRRPYEKDQRMLNAPLSLRIQAEKLLYEIGKCTLETYGFTVE